jgi:repressor LexA
MNDLTERQQEILAFIREHSEQNGMPPSRAEISSAFGFQSRYAAQRHIEALARKGALEWAPNTSRGLRVPGETGLPLIGRVAAGQPILAQEHVMGHYPVAPALFKPSPDYLLQVRGMSMRDAGILDGDWLAVHKTEQARNGQMVVARIDDDVTVKTLRIKGHHAELLPANPEFNPIVLDLRRDSLVIEGLAVGVIRSFNAS